MLLVDRRRITAKNCRQYLTILRGWNQVLAEVISAVERLTQAVRVKGNSHDQCRKVELVPESSTRT